MFDFNGLYSERVGTVGMTASLSLFDDYKRCCWDRNLADIGMISTIVKTTMSQEAG